MQGANSLLRRTHAHFVLPVTLLGILLNALRFSSGQERHEGVTGFVDTLRLAAVERQLRFVRRVVPRRVRAHPDVGKTPNHVIEQRLEIAFVHSCEDGAGHERDVARQAFGHDGELHSKDLGDSGQKPGVLVANRRPTHSVVGFKAGAFRDERHLKVSGGAPLWVVVTDELRQRGMLDDAHVEGLCNRLHRHIIVRWTDASRGEKPVVRLREQRDFMRNDVELVEHHHDAAQFDADRAKRTRECVDVRVGDFAAQKLIANDERSGRFGGRQGTTHEEESTRVEAARAFIRSSGHRGCLVDFEPVSVVRLFATATLRSRRGVASSGVG
jgi:hypothetical protein